MSDKGKPIIRIIIFSVIFLLIGGIAGYFIGQKTARGNFKGGETNFPNNNFRLNESVKTEIESFFQGTTSIEEINIYCQKNPMYCMEYCKTINPSSEVCSELDFNIPGGMPAR
jgi:hypothetical protein